MRISIIVPAFNEEKLIASSLGAMRQAAAAFARRGWTCEVVVCDNNSTDRTAELARTAGATVVFEPVNQIARARNRGASAARGDWLIFVDADSHPTIELFADVAEVMAEGRVVGGGCVVRMEGIRPGTRMLVGLWNWISRVRRWAAGSFVFCEAAAFRKIGGFSQELFAAEEIDFSQRLKRQAREQGRAVCILTRHPLLTSARRTELYSLGEHLRIGVKALFRPRRTLTRREDCIMWYDGRR